MASHETPSLRDGWHLLGRSIRLVLAVWIVPTLLLMPLVGTLQAGLGRVLGHLPPDPPRGELTLAAAEALGRIAPALAVPVLLALAGSWAWTVLWHSGLVSWRVWAAGRPQRLGEVLGLGLGRWWRYARLSAVATAAAALAGAAVWWPVTAAAGAARRALHEARAVDLVLAGIAASAVLAALLWAATLRALWELARPGRRSAVAAWLRGLAGALRHPLASVGTLLVWALPAAVLWALPAAGAATLAGPLAVPGGIALLQLAALLRAACWVGLVGSFAPVAGLGPLPPLERPAAASGGDASG